MTNDRREFLVAGMMALAGPALSERLAAKGSEPRVEGQQPAANPSRAVATEGRAESEP